MSRKRTRTEKIRIAEKKQQSIDVLTNDTYSLPKQLPREVEKTTTVSDFFAYDIRLVAQDIRKTMIVVTLFVIALIGISFQLR